MLTDLVVKVNGYTGVVLVQKYEQNGGICLSLIDPEDFQPILTATVNLEAKLPDTQHVWIKGWSENKGVPEAFEEAGIIKRTGRTAKTGFVLAEEAVLTSKFWKFYTEKH